MTFNGRLVGPRRLAVPLWRLRAAAWAARGREGAVVASHESAAYASLLLRRARILRRPILVMAIAVEHSLTERSLAARLKRWLLRAADEVVVFASSQVAPVGELLPGTRVSFMPLGVDTRFFAPDQGVARGDLVLSVGTNPGKDYPTLVQALPESTRLLVVTDQANIEQALPFVGTKDVSFASNVAIGQLRELYRSCRVLVLPLRDAKMSTGQTVLLENLALGTPVIVTDVPCVRDYTASGAITTVPEGDVESLSAALRDPGPASEEPTPFTAQATARSIANRLERLVRS